MSNNLHIADLWVGDQPELECLDLSGEQPSSLIVLENLPSLKRVLLPASGRGARMEIIVQGRLPDAEIVGRVAEIHFRVRVGSSGHAGFGFYSLAACNGLLLGSVRPSDHSCRPTLEVRVNEVKGALEFRRLGCDGRDPGWRSLVPSRSIPCFEELYEWLGSDPGRLSALVRASDASSRCLQRSLIDSFWREDWKGLRGRTLQRRILGSLNDLVGRGADPASAWLVRCTLNLAVWGQPKPNALLETVRRARLSWPAVGRESPTGAHLRGVDLDLMGKCRESSLVRSIGKRLPESIRLHQLKTLAGAVLRAGERDDHGSWLAGLLASCLRVRRRQWEGASILPEDARLSDVLDYSRQLGMPYLDTLIERLSRIRDDTCSEQFIALARAHLSPQDQIDVGLFLIEKGVRQARGLLLEALRHGSFLDAEQRAQASGGLFMPLGPSGGDSLVTHDAEKRRSASEQSGQCEFLE